MNDRMLEMRCSAPPFRFIDRRCFPGGLHIWQLACVYAEVKPLPAPHGIPHFTSHSSALWADRPHSCYLYLFRTFCVFILYIYIRISFGFCTDAVLNVHESVFSPLSGLSRTWLHSSLGNVGFIYSSGHIEWISKLLREATVMLCMKKNNNIVPSCCV